MQSQDGQTDHKVIVIVVDSLTSAILTEVREHTEFPAFRFLLEHGHYFPDVVSSFPAMTVSDLSTLLTGTYPETHKAPGLVWFDVRQGQIVNYGNNIWQTLKLGLRSVSLNMLYHLNATDLSNHVTTVFEALQDAGYTTGAINVPVHRGRTQHQLSIPWYLRPLIGESELSVKGPDIFIHGAFTENPIHGGDGLINNLGMNDDFAARQLVQLIKEKALPDLTVAYLPDNDRHVHRHGVDQLRGIKRVDKNLEKILDTYDTWDHTLKHVVLIIMGDSGVSPVWTRDRRPTIMLRELLRDRAIYRWGASVSPGDELVFAVNSRMAYVYLLNDGIHLRDVAKRLTSDDRMDVIAWVDADKAFAVTPENSATPLVFRPGGTYRDLFNQVWEIDGNAAVLDLSIGDGRVEYGQYPDGMHLLWSALHSHEGRFLVVTAKRGYQFGDERAPKHPGGAQQASLLREDILTPMIVAGTDRTPRQPIRFVDLKSYLLSLVDPTLSDDRHNATPQDVLVGSTRH